MTTVWTIIGAIWLISFLIGAILVLPEFISADKEMDKEMRIWNGENIIRDLFEKDIKEKPDATRL